MFIPKSILQKLYTKGTLRRSEDYLHFELKNRLKAAELHSVDKMGINRTPVELSNVRIRHKQDDSLTAFNASDNTIELPLGATLSFAVPLVSVEFEEQNHLSITLKLAPFGEVTIEVEDVLREQGDEELKIPRDNHDNLSDHIIRKRQEYVKALCNSDAPLLFDYRGPTEVLNGNIASPTQLAAVYNKWRGW